MKRLLFILTIAFMMAACDQKVGMDYAYRDGVYFDYYYKYLIYTVEFDSVIFSFGLIPDEIKTDTAKLAVKILGASADHDRYYRVKINPELTTAVEGVHYQKLDELQRFGAGKIVDTLRIPLYREALNTSHITQEQRVISFKLEESDDFTIGLVKGLNMKLSFNNYLSEPKWWSTYERYLYYYHPEKWKILISFDEGFANFESIPWDQNSGLVRYANSLNSYLSSNTVRDKETGDIVKMTELIPNE